MRYKDAETYQLPVTYGRYALVLLLSVNLLNYIDRQVLYAVFPLIKEDFHLSDTALGFLGSAFMICYMASAPILGWLGDRMSRAKLAAGGLAVWSFATGGAGFAAGYPALFAARTTVGIGEASFGTVSPGLLADYFPRELRGRVLSYFFLAIPVGSALGYLLGGVLGHLFGWHAAFRMAGVPGLLLTVPLWFLREPVRGGREAYSSSASHDRQQLPIVFLEPLLCFEHACHGCHDVRARRACPMDAHVPFSRTWAGCGKS